MAEPNALRLRPTAREALYLGLLMLLVFAISVLTLPSNPTGPDATTYLGIAREQIAKGDFWSDPSSLVGNFWAVGYPTALALSLRVFGENLTPVIVIQSLLMASLVLVPWVLAAGLPRQVQVTAPTALALMPTVWALGHSIGYEALLAWLVSFSFALAWILRHRAAGTSRVLVTCLAALSGLLLALAMLTQTKVLVLVPVVGYLLVRAGRLPAVAVALAFLLGLLPWMIRNAAVLGNPSPLSGNGGYNLWVGNNPDATTGGSMLIAPPTPNGESMTSAALHFMVSQPERAIELTWSKAARLLQPIFVYFDQVPLGPPRTGLHVYAAAVGLMVTVGVVAFLGTWLLRGRQGLPPVTVLAVAVLLWFVSHLPFIAEPRFMTTILPISITIAVAAWWMVATRWRTRSGSRAAEAHAAVRDLERRGMPVALDLTIPSWRADAIVVHCSLIEPSSTITIPAQECGLPEEQHSWPDLNVRTLTNVLLDVDSSLVFAGDRVIAQSGTGTRPSRDAAFVSGATFRIHEANPVRVSGPIAPLGDVHHHYHVMIETLPRLLHAKAYRPDVTFVTSEAIPQRYREALDHWSVRVHHVPAGTVLIPEELILVDQPELFWPRGSDLDVLRSAFDDVRAAAKAAQPIVVSRRKAARQLTDDNDFESALEQSGFDVVDMGQLDLMRQVSTFAGASLVAGLHGAGLAGIAFMEAGREVVELSSGEMFEGCYRRIAALTQLDYRLNLLDGDSEAPYGSANEALAVITGLPRKDRPEVVS